MTDSEAFDCLSSPIRHFIRKKGWTSFRPIQRAAIERITYTDNNYILASRTASGKTEAAFLPILSKVNFSERGVQVLYISPLIALINDQLNRIEELCHYMDVKITKWHGEASQSAKKELLKDPNGIVLITPESLEAMFENHSGEVRLLFSNLKYVIIDEIHYFIGQDRGIHLQSILYRLQKVNKTRFAVVGLSATIGDLSLAKNFVGDPDRTIVLQDPMKKPIDVSFRYFPLNGNELPIELVKDIFRTTYGKKSLIFPNSRGKVEEIAVKLKKLAQKINAPDNYFAHHASVNRDIREYIEFFAKNSTTKPFSICCTSTLELGIDIGSVDQICQVDATCSIASLIQRAGRSGRKDEKHAELVVYSTNRHSLLQAIACWNLHERGIIESPESPLRPYDVYVHQLLSIVKQYSEITPSALLDILHTIPVFAQISREDGITILKHLLSPNKQILELIDGKLIVGVDGERIVNSRDFYSLFIASRNFDAIYHGEKIGELDPLFIFRINVGDNIYLAAKIWKVKEIDGNKWKVYLEPAIAGKTTWYSGVSPDVNSIIEAEMLRLLYSTDVPDGLDDRCKEEIESMRHDFSDIPYSNLPVVPTIIEDCPTLVLYLFFGSKVNRTVCTLFSRFVETDIIDGNRISIKADESSYLSIIHTICTMSEADFRKIIEEQLYESSALIYAASKYGCLLPLQYQAEIVMQKHYDFTNAIMMLRKCIDVRTDNKNYCCLVKTKNDI